MRAVFRCDRGSNVSRTVLVEGAKAAATLVADHRWGVLGRGFLAAPAGGRLVPLWLRFTGNGRWYRMGAVGRGGVLVVRVGVVRCGGDAWATVEHRLYGGAGDGRSWGTTQRIDSRIAAVGIGECAGSQCHDVGCCDCGCGRKASRGVSVHACSGACEPCDVHGFAGVAGLLTWNGRGDPSWG